MWLENSQTSTLHSCQPLSCQPLPFATSIPQPPLPVLLVSWVLRQMTSKDSGPTTFLPFPLISLCQPLSSRGECSPVGVWVILIIRTKKNAMSRTWTVLGPRPCTSKRKILQSCNPAQSGTGTWQQIGGLCLFHGVIGNVGLGKSVSSVHVLFSYTLPSQLPYSNSILISPPHTLVNNVLLWINCNCKGFPTFCPLLSHLPPTPPKFPFPFHCKLIAK